MLISENLININLQDFWNNKIRKLHPSLNNFFYTNINYKFQVDQPKWGVGSRWPYLAGIRDHVIQNYTSLMIQTAINLGINF